MSIVAARPAGCPVWVPAAILGLTVVQLAVGAFVPGLTQFEGKAFGARLAGYPVMMLVVPATWWLVHLRQVHRRQVHPQRAGDGGARGGSGAADAAAPPWGAFALVMAPFLVDVSGNTLDLYDTVTWWDDANHFVNWALLCGGVGLLLAGTVRSGWPLVLMITGVGAILAIGWELGEWYAFIRHGTELDTAYQDTLGDEALGSLGALLAGFVVSRRS